MKYLLFLLNRAKRSNLFLFLLNQQLGYSIPFNRPHSIKITEVRNDGVSVRLPYRRRNMNHLKGIHACALATAAEYASGISLLIAVGTGYRLVMKKINVVYHYQAKMDVVTSVHLKNESISNKILTPLQSGESVLFTDIVEVHDLLANHICTANIEWQIKNWEKVKVR